MERTIMRMSYVLELFTTLFGMKIYTRATSDICPHTNYATAPTDVVIGNSG